MDLVHKYLYIYIYIIHASGGTGGILRELGMAFRRGAPVPAGIAAHLRGVGGSARSGDELGRVGTRVPGPWWKVP